MLVLVIVSMFISSYEWTRMDMKEDWDALVKYLEEHSQPDSLVILTSWHLTFPFRYYYQGSLPVRYVHASIEDAKGVVRDMDAYEYLWVVRGVDRFPAKEDPWRIISQGLPTPAVDCQLFGMINKLELCMYTYE
jgi:hypothetical protein